MKDIIKVKPTKSMPSDLIIVNERPEGMDFLKFKALRKRMNEVIKWYTEWPTVRQHKFIPHSKYNQYPNANIARM